jgi:hypothetical protein
LSSAWKSLTPIMKKRNKALFKEKWLTSSCFDFPLMSLLRATLASSYPSTLPSRALLVAARSKVVPRSLLTVLDGSDKVSPSQPFTCWQGLGSPLDIFYLYRSWCFRGEWTW